jgi:hypothetical protein
LNLIVYLSDAQEEINQFPVDKIQIVVLADHKTKTVGLFHDVYLAKLLYLTRASGPVLHAVSTTSA